MRFVAIIIPILVPPCSEAFTFHRHHVSPSFQRFHLVSSVQETDDATSNDAVAAAADELRLLVVRRFRGEAVSNALIEDLKSQLIEARVKFDPDECLNGPMYATLHTFGPEPFWEKYTKVNVPGGARANLKGQQYKVFMQGEPSSWKNPEATCQVLNYAELFGEAVHVRAVGKCRRDDSNKTEEGSEDHEQDEAGAKVETTATKKVKETSSPVEALNLFGKFEDAVKPFTSAETKTTKKVEEDEKTDSRLTCPVDYVIKATKAAATIFGNNFNIAGASGTGYLRVLYADPKLRIFVSPKDTSNPRIEERKGLTVVQVRVDEVDESFPGIQEL